MLSASQKDNRRFGRRYRGQGTSTLRVAVEFCDDDAADIHGVGKGQRLVVHCLALRRVHDQNHVVGGHCRRDFLHLLQQSRFLPMPTRRIDDDDLVVFFDKLIDSLFRNCHGIGLCVRTIERNSKFRCVLLELIEGSGAKGIGTHHSRLPPSPLVIIRVLSDRCGLSGSLQPHKQNNVRLAAFHPVGFPGGFQQLDELVDDRLLHHLGDVARPLFSLGVAVVFVLAVVVFDQSLHVFLDVFAEGHYQSDAHVGLDQRPGDLRQDLVQLRRRDMTRTRVQLAEGVAEFASQFGQHHAEYYS
mmetsp:Transcript_15248/g.34908  ORF Transcript_15248/g.34908 Transcript_15248/m.34908 type:complete len:300 (-) Transcript_15248:1-900(-)